MLPQLSELLNQLSNESEVRATLSSLRGYIKETKTGKKDITKTTISTKEIRDSLKKQEKLIFSFLSHEDAKTRKNCALLLGEVFYEEAEEALFRAYEKEETLFVRPAYLEALRLLGSESYIAEFKKRLYDLEHTKSKEEATKHLQEEKRLLRILLSDACGQDFHRFVGFHEPASLILTTNRVFVPKLKEQLVSILGDKCSCKELGSGVSLTVENLEPILKIRTYDELLFVLPQGETDAKETDTKALAKAFMSCQPLELFHRLHEKKDQPYRFRIDYKADYEPDKKGKLLRRLANEIEEESNHHLVNSTTDYEWELRLVKNRDGKLRFLIKLYTMPDERFSYRKEAISTGMRPVRAAIVLELFRDYLKEKAQVLDPFCGSGTLLIERAKLEKVGNLYGIDTLEEALFIAKKNMTAAGLFANFIHRSFFDFHHEYLFDEIITDLPFVERNRGSVKQKEDSEPWYQKKLLEIETIYRRFFEKAKELLKPEGVVILYAHHPEFVKKYAKSYGFLIEKNYVINQKEKIEAILLKQKISLLS